MRGVAELLCFNACLGIVLLLVRLCTDKTFRCFAYSGQKADFRIVGSVVLINLLFLRNF